MSAEHVVQVLECPFGNHPLVDPVIIGCKHILCRACADHAKKDNQIHCPVDTCRKSCLPSDLQSMTVIREFLQNPSVAGAYYPRNPTYTGPKAMEEDLLDDPDMDEYADRYHLPTDQSSDEGEGYERVDQPVTAMAVDEPPKPIFEYVDKDSKGRFADTVEKDKSWDIADVIKKFYAVIKEDDPILGFYESFEGDKIYVDVEDGCAKEVETFFEKNFKLEWKAQRIILIEQENDAEFLIITGDKIAAAQVADQAFPEVGAHIGEHPDNLSGSYGTVTCLGESDTLQQYAITAKHVLSTENRPQTEMGCYISNFNSRITQISNYFSGVLGGFQLNGETKQVDIAALPIADDIVQRFDHTLVHRLNDIYTGKDEQMIGATVIKRGASSGFTSGHIETVKYHLKGRSKTISGGHFLIVPNENYTDFCVKGDSGSLVWSTNGVPIGIVSKGRKNHQTNSGRKVNVTLAVRLDDCLNVLQQQVNVNIVKCKAYGAPLPYAPDAHNMNVSNVVPIPPT